MQKSRQGTLKQSKEVFNKFVLLSGFFPIFIITIYIYKLFQYSYRVRCTYYIFYFSFKYWISKSVNVLLKRYTCKCWCKILFKNNLCFTYMYVSIKTFGCLIWLILKRKQSQNTKTKNLKTKFTISRLGMLSHAVRGRGLISSENVDCDIM